MQTAATNSPVTQPRWYVVHCKPREDYRALEHLERQGFCCYLPTLKAEKLRHGRKTGVDEPLFPGYIFIHLDRIHDNWYPIRYTRGVHNIVRFNEHPLPVADEIIELIRDRLTSAQPRIPYLKPGERVRITDGCFANLEAIFVANDGDERVVLLMNVLHSEQTLSFPVASVKKCGNL
jgi:transcriptional antiterminator RfaH